MNIWQEIETAITAASGERCDTTSRQSLGGGSINQAWRVGDGGRSWFVKLNSAERLEMFIAEAEGLEALAAADAIRVPRPLCYGSHDGHSYLVMEYIALRGSPDPAEFATALAQMHKHTQPQYGWHRDNTIGSTPQQNTLCDDWIEFWRIHRLEFQLNLAQRNGAPARLIDRGMALAERCGEFFTGRTPLASVLHGDLWSGNWGADEAGRPVIFDPAVYFGDHETDLAMMTLFGHPGRRFFDHYNDHFSIDPGFATRKTLYNLYHILNHYNLFGGGYAQQAEGMIGQLLSELG